MKDMACISYSIMIVSFALTMPEYQAGSWNIRYHFRTQSLKYYKTNSHLPNGHLFLYYIEEFDTNNKIP